MSADVRRAVCGVRTADLEWDNVVSVFAVAVVSAQQVYDAFHPRR